MWFSCHLLLQAMFAGSVRPYLHYLLNYVACNLFAIPHHTYHTLVSEHFFERVNDYTLLDGISLCPGLFFESSQKH